MNRVAVLLAAIVSFVLAIALIVLGQRLILSLPVMIERGAGMPWYITWAMVWVTVGCAVVLGGFLVSSLRNPSSR
jgi:hypothetical protein